MEHSIAINDNQLKVLDGIVAEGDLGSTRQEALRAALKSHISHLLIGGTAYDAGSPAVLEVKKPEYGAQRFDHVMEPVTGKAVPVYKGEVLRIRQVVGGQCVDFNGYSLHDHKEYLDNGFNRMRGIPTGKGTIIWSGSPRARPMYAILECAETCDQFYAGHRCNAIHVEREYGLVDHPNCQDTFAESIREYGLTPDDVHDSYNFWMRTELDAEGVRRFPINRGQAGDEVDLLALFDTLAVTIVCGGDLSAVNSFDLNPMQVQVFEASPATLGVADQIQQRFGRYHSQKTREDFHQNTILAQPELRLDTNYKPQFLPAPSWQQLSVSLAPEEESMLQSLVQTGHYGRNAEKALVAAFLKWYELNRPRDLFAQLEIQG